MFLLLSRRRRLRHRRPEIGKAAPAIEPLPALHRLVPDTGGVSSGSGYIVAFGS